MGRTSASGDDWLAPTQTKHHRIAIRRFALHNESYVVDVAGQEFVKSALRIYTRNLGEHRRSSTESKAAISPNKNQGKKFFGFWEKPGEVEYEKRRAVAMYLASMLMVF